MRHPATWLMIFLPVSPTMATEVPTSFSLRPLASPRRKVILQLIAGSSLEGWYGWNTFQSCTSLKSLIFYRSSQHFCNFSQLKSIRAQRNAPAFPSPFAPPSPVLAVHAGWPVKPSQGQWRRVFHHGWGSSPLVKHGKSINIYESLNIPRKPWKSPNMWMFMLFIYVFFCLMGKSSNWTKLVIFQQTMLEMGIWSTVKMGNPTWPSRTQEWRVLHKTMVNMVMGQAPGTEIFHSRKNDATNTRNRPEGNDNSCKTSTGGKRNPSRTGTACKKHAPVTIV